ncbi:MAG: cytochrome c5 family protein [Spongiibacteraceae bacterium]|nr:cytochrome c5 family protein [Spongiibacteraceae bacterium]
MKCAKVGILALLLGVSLAVQAVSDKQKAEIAERIKPIGSVCVEGDSDCGSAVAATGASAAKSGDEIYNTSCIACHGTGAAGAPKLGSAADWGARLANKGIDQLYANAIGGLNAMPPKGLCMACSDDELKATVDYILEKSQ